MILSPTTHLCKQINCTAWTSILVGTRRPCNCLLRCFLFLRLHCILLPNVSWLLANAKAIHADREAFDPPLLINVFKEVLITYFNKSSSSDGTFNLNGFAPLRSRYRKSMKDMSDIMKWADYICGKGLSFLWYHWRKWYCEHGLISNGMHTIQFVTLCTAHASPAAMVPGASPAAMMLIHGDEKPWRNCLIWRVSMVEEDWR